MTRSFLHQVYTFLLLDGVRGLTFLADRSGNLAGPADKNVPADHLWEDSWDEDDIEDDFTKQLR